MKPLIFTKKDIHIDIYNYKFEKIGELKKNLRHEKYDLHLCKGKFISIEHLRQMVKYHDESLDKEFRK